MPADNNSLFRRPRNPFDKELPVSHYDAEGGGTATAVAPSRASSAYSHLPESADVTSPIHRASAEELLRTKRMALPPALPAEEPDTTLGEGVVFKGQLTFKKLLRIDGHFEGELISDGKLIVGPTGVVKANVAMREAIVEGTIEGNITLVERLELRAHAKVIGDIQTPLLSADEGVSIVGHVCVEPKTGA